MKHILEIHDLDSNILVSKEMEIKDIKYLKSSKGILAINGDEYKLINNYVSVQEGSEEINTVLNVKEFEND